MRGTHIVFPGSGADYELTRKGSRFLRKAGWSCLIVGFAGWEGLPEDPVLTPVEYAERAVEVLKGAGYDKIAMYGISAGAKYAITAAFLIPDVSLVIAGSPFDYTTEAFRGTKALNKSTFTWRGKPLPYDPTVTLHRNIISVLLRTAFSKKYGMRRMLRGCYEEEVLAVRTEYQQQGYMRKMMEGVYRLADRKKLPVILDTDDKNKSLRYQHLGMKLDRVRSCGEKFHMYDLIREKHHE